MKKFIITSFIIGFITFCLLEISVQIFDRKYLTKKVSKKQDSYNLKDYGYNNPDREISKKKDENEFRILSIGDSFAASIVKPSYSYSGVIEQNLQKHFPNKKITVVNLGVGGKSFPHYLRNIKFWSNHLEYDAILVNIYVGNDFTDTGNYRYLWGVNREISKNDVNIYYGRSLWIPDRFPLFRSLDYLYASLVVSEFQLKALLAKPATNTTSNQDSSENKYNSYFTRFPGGYAMPLEQYISLMVESSEIYKSDNITKTNIHNWMIKGGLKGLSAVLEELKAQQEKGKKILVSIAPPEFLYNKPLFDQVLGASNITKDDIKPEQPLSLITELFQKNNISHGNYLYDLTRCLFKYQSKENLYFGEAHWNVKGNKVVADILTDQMLDKWFGIQKNNLSDCSDADKYLLEYLNFGK